MKEYKASTILLLLSSLLILSLVVLMCIWGYNFYYNGKNNKTEIAAVKTTATNVTRDSLQQVYNTTIKNLDSRFDSTWVSADSAKTELDVKLDQFYKLRNEIASLLKNSSNSADLLLASQKITELQQKVNDLRNRTSDVEAENKRLHALLDQLSKTGNNTSTISITPDQNAAKATSYQTPAKAAANDEPILYASNFRITALGDKDKETTKAEETEKITGTFTVKNNMQYNGTEIMVVVLQPNGQILRTSPWESGMFDTKEDGKKVYSCRIRFDYSKGETKRCNFSISSDNYSKGNYTFQLYHNGIMIANMSKTLS